MNRRAALKMLSSLDQLQFQDCFKQLGFSGWAEIFLYNKVALTVAPR